ncbi:MAG: hypothetical protein HKN45_03135 [Flavobacteriales bacterium]|nr:hypothetical protein [Flavobacteriales bacterium]
MSEDINKKVDRVLNDMRAPFPSKDASWERLMHRIEAKEVRKEKKSNRFTYIAAVASIALITALVFVLSTDLKRVDTQLAEHKVIELPDGSTVSLNADSYIEFNETDFMDLREIHLDGEAFFQVKKGSKFDVITDKGTVSVLGTSFNVCDRSDFLEVTCETGKVGVRHAGAEIILTPGTATITKNGILMPAFKAEKASDWIRGSFDFQDDELAFVFDELERQFGVDVKANDIEGRYFTGQFNSTDLEAALTVICQPMGLDYAINEDLEIVVTSK